MVTGRQGSALLVAGVLAVAGLAQTGPGRVALRSLGLLKSSSYTALAFRHPQSLPSRLPDGHSALPVGFFIRNVSDSERVYRWTVVLSSGGRSKQMVTGDTRIAAGSAVAVDRTVTVVCPNLAALQRREATQPENKEGPDDNDDAPLKRLHLVVRLASPAESIGFWATCSAEKGRKNHG